MSAEPLTALIVDDERLARQELRALLAVHPEVQVVGEAASVDEAARHLAREQPDVVFLDIQMPGESGFDLFARAPVSSRVVFVTAHDAHALRAFDVNALDYLLKPVVPARLAESIARLREQAAAAPGGRAAVRDRRLRLPADRRAVTLHPGEPDRRRRGCGRRDRGVHGGRHAGPGAPQSQGVGGAAPGQAVRPHPS